MRFLSFRGVFAICGLLLGGSSAFAAVSSTCHWTGAEDGFWTNANNWAEGTVPGRYLVPADGYAATNGAPEGVAIFGDDLAGMAVTTIDMDGVYSISNLTTTGTHRYTYGTVETQFVPIEPWGTFSAAETPETPVAKVVCRIQCGVECMDGGFKADGVTPEAWYGKETIHIRNNSAEEFVLERWGWRTVSPLRAINKFGGGQTGIQIEGTGDFRIAATYAGGQQTPFFTSALTTGKLTVDTQIIFRNLTFASNGDTKTERIVEITEGNWIKSSEGSNYLSVGCPVRIIGKGIFYADANHRTTGWSNASWTLSYPFTVDCPVSFIWQKDPAQFPDEPFTDRFTWVGGNGPLQFNGGCDFQGTVRVGGDANNYLQKLIVTRFGASGEFGDYGDVDFRVGHDTYITYVGPGETVTRRIDIICTSANRKDVASAGIRQDGTGPLVIQSPVRLDSTIATHATFKLSGDSSVPAVFAGALGDNIGLLKTGRATWTFDPQLDEDATYEGSLALQGGTLVLAQDTALTSLAVDRDGSDYDNNRSTLVVAAGKKVTVGAAPTFANGSLVDFVLPVGASVQFPTGTALPAGVLVNGHAAKLDEEGFVRMDTSDHVWAANVDGAWSETDKWLNGAPGEEDIGYIDAPGDDYTVSVTADANARGAVVADFYGGTATLKVAAEKTITFTGCTKDLGGNATPLVQLKDGGRLEIDSGVVAFRDQGDAKTHLQTSFSPLKMAGGDVCVKGTGVLKAHGVPPNLSDDSSGNANSYFDFGTGTVTFQDNACFNYVPGEGKSSRAVMYLRQQPTQVGETSHVVFTNGAYMKMDAAAWNFWMRPNGGRAVWEVDTDYDKVMQYLWSESYIGYGGNGGRGTAEFIIRKGKLQTSSYEKFLVGTTGVDNRPDTSQALFMTGRVEIAEGGSLQTSAAQPLSVGFGGVVFGHGICVNKPRGQSYLYGELDVAGSFTQERGNFIVGEGPCAEGLVRQTGGAVTPLTLETPPAEHLGEVSIGIFGATGRYLMSAGTFKTLRNVYVGGATTNDLHRAHGNGDYIQQFHDAKGTVAVSGGTFETVRDMFLGVDGTGLLELSSTGLVKAASVTVSNTVEQAASCVKFTADEQGRFGSLEADRLVFAEGAKLIVDAANFPEKGRGWKLFTLKTPVEGLVDEEKQIDKVNFPKDAVLTWNADRTSLKFRMPRGSSITIR